jgi:hypothetical protein
MQLSEQKIEQLKRSIQLALNHEWPELSRINCRLAQVDLCPIALRTKTPLPVIATVATDGGESKLVLDPIRLHAFRVTNSAGEIFCEEFVPLSLTPDEIVRFFVRSNVRLQRFLNFLDLEWESLVPSRPFQSANLLRMLREIMEWAALMRLAHDPDPKLLLHDGLLRSVVLPDSAFRAIRNRFQELTQRHGHLLIGISKRSQIVNYLSISLSSDARFRDKSRLYLPIPRDLELAAAPPQYRWGHGRAMGTLFLARLDEGEQVPFMPVELAEWQADRVEEAMVLLAQDSTGSFPVRGYPWALINADEFARMGQLETELLESLVLSDLAGRDPAIVRSVREQMLFGRKLSQSFGNGPDAF